MAANYSEAVMEIQGKHHKARIVDRDFDPGSYMWVLGGEVWRLLWREYTMTAAPPPSDESAELMGIRVQINLHNPFDVRLFKEIK